MSARLATEIWVAAQIRRVELAGGAAYLRRRGAEKAGAVLVKLTRTDLGFTAPATTLLTRVTGPEGAPAWTWLVGPEPALDAAVEAKLEKQIAFDPDLWILEIEDREGRAFLDDPIL